MVLQFVLPALVGFTFVMLAAYAGTLRALDVYFDPDSDSIFSPTIPSRRGCRERRL